MKIRWPNFRDLSPRDLSVGDFLIIVALIALVASVLYPTLRARAFRDLVETAIADVETMSDAARRAFTASGSWPASTAPGVMPTEIAGAFPGDTTLSERGYALQWRQLEVVEQVEGPPVLVGPDDADAPPDSVGPRLISVARPIGAIVMHSGRSELLAELLRRYGPGESFVRDTMWTLVVVGSGGIAP